MNFKVQKVENCFSDSETYEYLLPISGKSFLQFASDWDIRVNDRLRRPAAILTKEGITIKCILEGCCFRVSFPAELLISRKAEFEAFLRSLPCTE